MLVLLAGCVLFVKFNYDDRKALPDDVASSVGYSALDRHFPVNTTIPQYLLVQSPRDLRTPQALADLEQMAQRISQLPDIAAVRGITRPSGEPLKEASTTFQAGEVGSKLNDASGLIRDRSTDLDKLASGADQLADGLATLRAQVTKLLSGLSGVLTTMQTIQNQFGGATTLGQLGDSERSSAACGRSATRCRRSSAT